MTWGLTSAQVLNLTRGSDGVVFGLARTGGSNNPALQAIVQDSTGVGFGYSGSPYMNFLQAGGITVSQPVAFATSGATSPVQIQGSAGAFALFLTGSSSTGNSDGMIIRAGTNASDAAIEIQNQSGSVGFFNIFGDGHGSLGPSGALGASWNTSGVLTWTTTAGQLAANFVAGPVQAGTSGIPQFVFQNAGAGQSCIQNDSALNWSIAYGTGTAGSTTLGTKILQWNSAGNVTVAAASSGTSFSVNGVAANYTAQFLASSSSSNSYGLLIEAGTNSSDQAFAVLNQGGVTPFFRVYGDGGAVVGNPTGGDQGSGILNAGGLSINANPVYAGIPQNAQSGAYQLVLSDANKHIYKGTGTAAITIPANATVAFPIGTAITIVNDGSGSCAVNITTDTLIWAPPGTSGNRSLALFGEATLLKVGATRWYISGVGIS
jgi:hypothetical protein